MSSQLEWVTARLNQVGIEVSIEDVLREYTLLRRDTFPPSELDLSQIPEARLVCDSSFFGGEQIPHAKFE